MASRHQPTGFDRQPLVRRLSRSSSRRSRRADSSSARRYAPARPSRTAPRRAAARSPAPCSPRRRRRVLATSASSTNSATDGCCAARRALSSSSTKVTLFCVVVRVAFRRPRRPATVRLVQIRERRQMRAVLGVLFGSGPPRHLGSHGAAFFLGGSRHETLGPLCNDNYASIAQALSCSADELCISSVSIC